VQMVRLTHAQWLAEAERRYGKSLRNIRFRCPSCGHVQSGQDFLDLDMTPEVAATRVGFSCIGRWASLAPRDAFAKGEGPCNYAGGGLFRIAPIVIAPIVVTTEGGEAVYVFDFADD